VEVCSVTTQIGLLRQAQRADIAQIQRVRHSVHENKLTSGVITDAEVQAYIESVGRGWVIEAGGEVVAFAFGNKTNGNIWALFVDPHHERRGYGRRLHDTMNAWLWEQGLEELWLTTQPATRAQRFYQNAGWQQAEITRHGEILFKLRRTQFTRA
jgi:N-acetylglutamate synthase-like GNAT family acetyltransferase